MAILINCGRHDAVTITICTYFSISYSSPHHHENLCFGWERNKPPEEKQAEQEIGEEIKPQEKANIVGSLLHPLDEILSLPNLSAMNAAEAAIHIEELKIKHQALLPLLPDLLARNF